MIVPIVDEYAYDGPIYCSEPTKVLMTVHQLDYLDVHSREGEHSPFDQKDVREVVTHTIPLRYNVVTDVAPDIKLTLHNAGHILEAQWFTCTSEKDFTMLSTAPISNSDVQ